MLGLLCDRHLGLCVWHSSPSSFMTTKPTKHIKPTHRSDTSNQIHRTDTPVRHIEPNTSNQHTNQIIARCLGVCLCVLGLCVGFVCWCVADHAINLFLQFFWFFPIFPIFWFSPIFPIFQFFDFSQFSRFFQFFPIFPIFSNFFDFFSFRIFKWIN